MSGLRLGSSEEPTSSRSWEHAHGRLVDTDNVVPRNHVLVLRPDLLELQQVLVECFLCASVKCCLAELESALRDKPTSNKKRRVHG